MEKEERNKIKTEEDFGKGFVYNLILFAKHWKDIDRLLDFCKDPCVKFPEHYAVFMWISGASDHLFGLEIPPKFKRKKIGKLAKWLQQRCFELRNRDKEATLKDFNEIFDKLEELAMLIDKELGVEPIEAIFK